ncbi:Uncharacterised protein [uncultured archaeon]|nr:Uncharacterised protein [uncultured archaeon]
MSEKKVSHKLRNSLIGLLAGAVLVGSSYFAGDYAINKYVQSQLNKPETLTRAKESIRKSAIQELEKSVSDPLYATELGACQTLDPAKTFYHDSITQARQKIQDDIDYEFQQGKFSFEILQEPSFFKKFNKKNWKFSLVYNKDKEHPLATFGVNEVNGKMIPYNVTVERENPFIQKLKGDVSAVFKYNCKQAGERRAEDTASRIQEGYETVTRGIGRAINRLMDYTGLRDKVMPGLILLGLVGIFLSQRSFLTGNVIGTNSSNVSLILIVITLFLGGIYLYTLLKKK